MMLAADALDDARRTRLPRHVRFALVRQPANPLAKPTQFNSLDELAQGVHRVREFGAIELLNAALMIQGEREARHGVSVWRLGPDGARHTYIGWAYLAGGDREALKTALLTAQPVAEDMEEAA